MSINIWERKPQAVFNAVRSFEALGNLKEEAKVFWCKPSFLLLSPALRYIASGTDGDDGDDLKSFHWVCLENMHPVSKLEKVEHFPQRPHDPN